MVPDPGPRSGWIGILLADLDPHPFRPNVKLNCIVFQKILKDVQNIENYDTYEADDKDKTSKQTL